MKHLLLALLTAAVAALPTATANAQQRINLAELPALPAEHPQVKVASEILRHALSGDRSALEGALKSHGAESLRSGDAIGRAVAALLALTQADGELALRDFTGPRPGDVIARMQRGGGQGMAVALFRFESADSPKVSAVNAPAPGQPLVVGGAS